MGMSVGFTAATPFINGFPPKSVCVVGFNTIFYVESNIILFDPVEFNVNDEALVTALQLIIL